MHSHARRTIVTLVKIALAIGILAYLIIQARDGFSRLHERTFSWPFLAGAFAFSLATALLSFLRWHILIRALNINIRLFDSLSLGALGFAMNFVSPGSVGGDFFKAVFLAHGQPGQRTEAVASVIADRVLGLLTMLTIASAGILATNLLHADLAWLQVLSETILTTTAIGWVGFLLFLFVDALSGPRIIALANRLPLTGRVVTRFIGAAHLYRHRTSMMAAAFAVSAVMVACFITSFYFVARGLGIDAPPWTQHAVIAPMAGVAGAIPLTPNGLGSTEFTVEKLYLAMPGGAAVVPGDGTFASLGRRVTDIVVALLGLAFYLTHKREVQEVMAEAEEAADNPQPA
ncbi:MAG: lysylphosphatidylglycerol synthase transmembrane domain-containing protein [Pirellulales bacterium]